MKYSIHTNRRNSQRSRPFLAKNIHLKRPLGIRSHHPRNDAPFIKRLAVFPDCIASPGSSLDVIKIHWLHHLLRGSFPQVGIGCHDGLDAFGAGYVDFMLIAGEGVDKALDALG
jgi:hypothetical protein